MQKKNVGRRGDAKKGMIKYASLIALSVSWIAFLELSAGSVAWNSF